jgi:hypothetical protein
MTKSGRVGYPLQSDVLNFVALANIFAQEPHTYFLPQAYPKDPRRFPAAHFDEDFGHSIRTPAERAAWDGILDLILPATDGSRRLISAAAPAF